MNNEEKNLSAENEAVEENNNTQPASAPKKLSGGVIGAIIGGVAAVVAIIVLLITLLGGNGANDGEGGGEGGGDPTDTKITYTVTVVDTDGNPIKGVKVSFNPKGSMSIPFPTDDSGKSSYKTDKDLTATITEIPSGYEYDKLNVAQKFDSDGKLTVTLTKLAPLVIKVVDQDGNAIAGVRVQMCDSTGSCRMPRPTGEDGTASYPYEEGEFHAQLTNGLAALPDGYTVENPEQYYNFVDGVATIKVTKIED